MTLKFIPTLAGQAAIAAAQSGGPAITLSTIQVGDGNGAEINPLETMTSLVNPRATKAIDSVVRDGNRTTVKALLGTTVGGFTIREIGVFNPGGEMLYIGQYPATDKKTELDGVFQSLWVGGIIIVSGSATIVLQPPPDSLVSLAQMLRAPWITVDSIANAPPGSPTLGATVLVGIAPTGAYVGQANALAQWNGAQWVFKNAPLTSLVSVVATGTYLRLTNTGWVEWFPPDHLVDAPTLLFFGCL